ncbi:uncharacterized protein N7483_006366 [Penicillium malachiteum]|uniref:uncharacterized protein n=1 Tax=Penicillium malachiteum TaxID=1324776 RepID=UPI002546D2CB|nr:uncharacterized protein N7483_006366 [Penicillium malachiteum]KAJ5725009.1 hypothetical protein N7483_006366 [Penicillium malachiteum]
MTDGSLAVSSLELANESATLTPTPATEFRRELDGVSCREPTANSVIFDNAVVPDPSLSSGFDFMSSASGNVNDDLLGDANTTSDSGNWFLEDGFDVGALDLTINSSIFEWAQLPNISNASNIPPWQQGNITHPQSSAPLDDPAKPTADLVKEKWFTYMKQRSGWGDLAQPSALPGQTSANDIYRAGLTQKLRSCMEDEALPTSDQLNLFAKLYFQRFHPLLPVIHAASFKPKAENSLLFLSICSIGSLFVGSKRAVMQGSRIFERLNKAILASWESFLSQSRPDALSMVQAAILGQTYALLAGNPKHLVLADVLHGTVAAWSREANKISYLCQKSQGHVDDTDIDSKWLQWIETEQRARVQMALNIHDAELGSLLHHQPIHSHRFRQYPRLALDVLFDAPTASKWATLYYQTSQAQIDPVNARVFSRIPNSLPETGQSSWFTAYGALESINARLVDLKESHEFDYMNCQDISNLLIEWWNTYHPLNQEPFCLRVLWQSIFIYLYADVDLLERAIGRDGDISSCEATAQVREWASTPNASLCLIHASLIARHIEQMNISVEPAIHVPRALFSATLTYICVARYAPKHIIRPDAFLSPEMKMLGNEACMWQGLREAGYSLSGEGSMVVEFDDMYRLINLLQRCGKWGISQAFATVLSIALEERKDNI